MAVSRFSCYVIVAICHVIQDGETALMNASRYGYKEVIELLLAHGADLNAKDKVSYLDLFTACNLSYLHLILFSSPLLILGGSDGFDEGSDSRVGSQ